MLASWNWIRIIRLIFGGIGLAQGIVTHNTILSAIGVLLLFQGAFNVGCCGTACAIPTKKNSSPKKSNGEVEFEEVQ
jgi:hypothetical protein